MQIVIDIIEQDCERVVHNSRIPVARMRNAIRNGTIIPKGHGRLIDADALIRTYDGFVGYDEEIQSIKDADTIIEADTESEE